MTLQLSYGNAVVGDQRFSRPSLEEKFIRTLTCGVGVKMFGLRRIGKSTLRQVALEHFEREKMPYAFIDGQGMHSLSDLLSRLFRAMPADRSFMNRALGLISSGPVRVALEAISSGMGKDDEALSGYWDLVSDAVRKTLQADGPKPVLVIDEFSYLISNMVKRDEKSDRGDTDRLLASLREWRGDGMVMLLTGSIGLTALARKHALNVDHLNDLQPFIIPELTPEEARDFVQSAAQVPSQGRWTEAHTEEFLKQSGVLYPSFLVRGLLEIGIRNPPDADAFAAIFARDIRPSLHDEFFNQFDRRFKAYGELPGGEQEKLILPGLKAIMEAEDHCAHDAIPSAAPFTRVDLSVALSMLIEDGFIHFTEDEEGERLWKPASNLAKLWWKRSKLA